MIPAPKGTTPANVFEFIMPDYIFDVIRERFQIFECTVRFSDLVYVLHVFQKKSKKGIATPKPDMDIIRKQLKLAEEDHKVRQSRGAGP